MNSPEEDFSVFSILKGGLYFVKNIEYTCKQGRIHSSHDHNIFINNFFCKVHKEIIEIRNH